MTSHTETIEEYLASTFVWWTFFTFSVLSR